MNLAIRRALRALHSLAPGAWRSQTHSGSRRSAWRSCDCPSNRRGAQIVNERATQRGTGFANSSDEQELSLRAKKPRQGLITFSGYSLYIFSHARAGGGREVIEMNDASENFAIKRERLLQRELEVVQAAIERGASGQGGSTEGRAVSRRVLRFVRSGPALDVPPPTTRGTH